MPTDELMTHVVSRCLYYLSPSGTPNNSLTQYVMCPRKIQDFSAM